MAFTRQTPRVFTQENIGAIDPDQSGVYGLFKEGIWIYKEEDLIKLFKIIHYVL